MNRSGNVPLLVIDVAGASVVALCVLVCVWLTVVRPDGAKAEITELTRLIDGAQTDLASLRAAYDHQNEVLTSRNAELAARGRLPRQTPVEEYFRLLSHLATRHRLRVVSQNPLSPRRYPGLLEQRFAYQVTGTTPDLAYFFQEIERSDFWADISYLAIEGGHGAAVQTPGDRAATLTFSLFSVPPLNGATDNG